MEYTRSARVEKCHQLFHHDVFLFSFGQVAQVNARGVQYFSVYHSVLVEKPQHELKQFFENNSSQMWKLGSSYEDVIQRDLCEYTDVDGWDGAAVRFAVTGNVLVHKFFRYVAPNTFDVDALWMLADNQSPKEASQ